MKTSNTNTLRKSSNPTSASICNLKLVFEQPATSFLICSFIFIGINYVPRRNFPCPPLDHDRYIETKTDLTTVKQFQKYFINMRTILGQNNYIIRLRIPFGSSKSSIYYLEFRNSCYRQYGNSSNKITSGCFSVAYSVTNTARFNVAFELLRQRCVNADMNIHDDIGFGLSC